MLPIIVQLLPYLFRFKVYLIVRWYLVVHCFSDALAYEKILSVCLKRADANVEVHLNIILAAPIIRQRLINSMVAISMKCFCCLLMGIILAVCLPGCIFQSASRPI